MPDDLIISPNDPLGEIGEEPQANPVRNSSGEGSISSGAKPISLKRLDGSLPDAGQSALYKIPVQPMKNRVVAHAKEKEEEGVAKNITVYSMPKEYVGAKEKGKKPKVPSSSSGKRKSKHFTVLIIAFVLVLAVSAALYVFVIKPPQGEPHPVPLIDETAPQTEDETTPPSQENVTSPQGSSPVDEIPGGPPVQEEVAPSAEIPQEPGWSGSLDAELVQKVAVSYNEQGEKTTEAVLTLEKETGINYSLITLSEYIIEKKPEFFALVAGQPYAVNLRGEHQSAAAVLSITYTTAVLEEHSLIPADLRIGYLSYEKLEQRFTSGGTVTTTNATGTPSSSQTLPNEIWEVLRAQDLDSETNSVSSQVPGIAEGIYAIVPIYVNEMIELPANGEEEITDEDVVIQAMDSDHDGLTDKEETLYGTSPKVVDSDSDGYSDGQEVLNLFSPARGAGVVLEDDAQFVQFSNDDFGYFVLHPKSFAVSPVVAQSARDMIFASPDKETILISVQDNPDGLPLKDWLISVSPQIDVTAFEEFTTLEGYTALKFDSGTAYYVQSTLMPSRVYVLSYSTGGEYTYLSTFRMMVESVVIKNK